MQAPLRALLLAATALVACPAAALAEVPRVVATIKPVHALVASVMGELGTPALTVEGGASPHAYSLKPSNAADLQSADLVFWTGHGMELFLEDSIATLAPGAAIVELATAPGLTLLPMREGGAFEAHDHGDHDGHDHDDHDHEHDHEAADSHDHDDHDHARGEEDMHFFLDPRNAALMVDAIEMALSEADPDNAATYAANADATRADLATLESELAAELAPVAGRPFVVFHDAYQYFEARFGLTVAGSITVNAEVAPGAARITEIRARLAELGAACVFAEPQFDSRVVDVLVEGTDAGRGVLDPEGADIEPGPGLYRTLMQRLADNLVACLGD